MNREEGDDSDIAPIPPYERSWRHPAEHAADERRRFEATSSPPPLSRRSRAFISAFAGVVGATLFVVSVPKGVRNDTVVDVDTTLPQSTAASVPTKGFASNPAIVVAGSHGSTTALVVDDRKLITALEEVTSNDTVWVTLPSGLEVEGRIAASDPESGLALVSIDAASDGDLVERAIPLARSTGAPPVAIEPANVSRLRLIDWLGSQQPTADDGLTTSTDGSRAIVHTPRTIAGVAAVTNNRGEIVGVAVRRAQATWILSIDRVKDVLTTVFADGSS